MSFLQNIENTIKIYRAIHDLTQGELAEKLGVSTGNIVSIEANKQVPSVMTAMAMARLFGITIEELFFVNEAERKAALPHISSFQKVSKPTE